MSEEKIKLNLGVTINPDNGWISLRNDKMFRKIFSENIKFVKLLLKSTFNFKDEELEGMIVTNGETIFPDNNISKNFIADIIVRLKNKDKVIIEMQSYNTLKSTIKNELYCYREISKQKIDKNNYDKINKVYQLVIIGDNRVITKGNVLLEPYTKRGDINKYHKIMDKYHKIMDKYHKTLWLDLNGKIDYTKDNKGLVGLVKLFIANSYEEALESVKYEKIMKEMIEKMRNYMSNEDMREYSDKELEYHECLREDLREEVKAEVSKELRKNLSKELREEVSKELREEVKEEVKSEQQYEIAKRMLLKGKTKEEIHEFTLLSLKKIDLIKSKLAL